MQNKDNPPDSGQNPRLDGLDHDATRLHRPVQPELPDSPDAPENSGADDDYLADVPRMVVAEARSEVDAIARGPRPEHGRQGTDDGEGRGIQRGGPPRRPRGRPRGSGRRKPPKAEQARRRTEKAQVVFALDKQFTERFLSEMDGRSKLYRELKARLRELARLYAPNNDPVRLSYAQRSLIKRVVFLEAVVESVEMRFVRGEEIAAEELSQWLRVVQQLQGLFTKLGFKRRDTPAADLDPLEWIQGKATRLNDDSG